MVENCFKSGFYLFSLISSIKASLSFRQLKNRRGILEGLQGCSACSFTKQIPKKCGPDKCPARIWGGAAGPRPLVGVRWLEHPASSSRTRRATSCATPRRHPAKGIPQLLYRFLPKSQDPAPHKKKLFTAPAPPKSDSAPFPQYISLPPGSSPG